MIVRILGEGQFEVDETERDALDQLDTALLRALDDGDESAFADALAALIAEVTRVGSPLPADSFSPSDLVVPFPDASLAETQALLGEAGGSEEPVRRGA